MDGVALVRPSRARFTLAACVVLAVMAGAIVPGARAGERVPIVDRSQHCLLPPGHRLPSASPVGFGGCSGVRPGAFFTSPAGGCSFNFLFRGKDGHRYIGTAGHCLIDGGGVETWSVGTGPVVRSREGATVGRGAYAINKGDQDFALIRLNRGVKANAQMCHFGGPTGIDSALVNSPVLLEHYGNGIGVSSLTPARTSLAMNTHDPDTVSAVGLAAFGDSGSGAMRSGRALGVIVAIGFNSSAVGNVFITRIAPQLDGAEQALDTTLTLQTAPRL